MKDQRSESLDRLGEHVSKAATNAIANAINTDTIAKAIDTNAVAKAIDTDAIAKAIDTNPITDAVMKAVTASLKEAKLTNELSTQASIIGEKIGESVASAIKSAMAASEPKAIMDATTMREQTLTNIEAIYELFRGTVTTIRYPLKIVTKYGGSESASCFSASVVRSLVPGYSVGSSAISEAIECDSDLEALQRVYRCSQLLLNRACGLSGRGGPGFCRWYDLGTNDFDDDWDRHCGMVFVSSGFAG